MKYIVKNCPALYNGAEKWKLGFGENEHICKDGIRYCKNHTDCIIKQIVESCKNVNCDILINTRINNKTRKNRCGAMDGMPLCCEVIAKKDILNLLEIEEVDEQL